MAKQQLSVSFKTVHVQCKNGGFQTGGGHDENKAVITNVSEAIISLLKSSWDVTIDYVQKTITMMRNAQLMVPMSEQGYAMDIVITFQGGKLMAVPR